MRAPSAPHPSEQRAFSVSSPSGLAVITVAAMALVALGFALWPMLSPAPPPDASASQSEQVSPTVEPSPTPTPTPTVVPPTATSEPTPTPTPVAQWIGLDWSEPVTPAFTVHLYDVAPWGDGYVAVGEVDGDDRQGDAAFLDSPNGVTWTVTNRLTPGFARIPDQLVVLGQRLLAFSRPDTRTLPLGNAFGHLVWSSTDGKTWAPVESPSWREAWAGLILGPMPAGWDVTQHEPVTGLVDVVGGPHGLVAIGNAFADGVMEPIILHSTNGEAWTAAGLPAGSESPLLNSVVERSGRYVITGATGIGADPSAAVAAAWYSDDGVTWVRATIEPGDPRLEAGAEFGPLWASDGGLLTCSGSREMTAGGWRYMTGWVSSDGAKWQLAPLTGAHVGCDWSASDGVRIVSLGPRGHASPTEWPGVTRASISIDAIEWRSLDLNQTLTDRPERFWVVPDGVIYAGVESFWFGTPVLAP